nr:3607_t:CDS:1 [Entrophospora candida]CAG8574102.1 3959_t:CDS:1 [Entrophospora candida]
MPRVRIQSDAPLFSQEDYSYIMQCRDMKPRYKILNDLTGKYKTSTKRIYQIWRGEEANRVLWDQPIPDPYEENDIHYRISDSHLPSTDKINIGTMNDLHIGSQSLDRGRAYPMSQRDSPTSLLSNNVSGEQTQPNKQTKTKIRSSTSIDNTSRMEADLEKLMKDTEKLAPMCPSLPQ